MTPIPVGAILALIQTGYPVDFVFRACVQTVNGVENRFGGEALRRSAVPEFYELLRRLKKIQQSGRVGMRVKPMEEKETLVMFIRPPKDSADREDALAVLKILGLDLEALEFRVVFGSIAIDNREIALLTRSMLQIMIELASHIEVPQEDVEEGRVYVPVEETPPDFPNLIRIQSGGTTPDEAYVSVRYRNRSFWIDDRDRNSKRMFAFMMLLFSLTETGGQGAAPIVTVPTN